MLEKVADFLRRGQVNLLCGKARRAQQIGASVRRAPIAVNLLLVCVHLHAKVVLEDAHLVRLLAESHLGLLGHHEVDVLLLC